MTTFVLRLQPLEPSSAAARPPGPGHSALRGVVDEIATGVTRTFASTAELLDILAAALRAEVPASANTVAERSAGGTR